MKTTSKSIRHLMNLLDSDIVETKSEPETKPEMKLSFIKELNYIVNEGSLIPMPSNTFYVPNSDYEFYRMLQYIVDPDKGPKNHMLSNPHSIMVPNSAAERDLLKKILHDVDIMTIDNPMDVKYPSWYSIKNITAHGLDDGNTVKDDKYMVDLMNNSLYNSDNRPDNFDASRPKINQSKMDVPLAPCKNDFSKQGKSKNIADIKPS